MEPTCAKLILPKNAKMLALPANALKVFSESVMLLCAPKVPRDKAQVKEEDLHSAAIAKRFRISGSVSSAMKKYIMLFNQVAFQDKVQEKHLAMENILVENLRATLKAEDFRDGVIKEDQTAERGAADSGQSLV